MRALIACEESQAVTVELRKRGVEAYSCDILPCSGGHPEWHRQQDVTELLRQPWDLVICFPPCTHLASSGARHFAAKRADGRQQAAIHFFMLCIQANAPRVAVENPVGIMSTEHRKPDQIVQPWQFGHQVQKSTCLWLKGLPKLQPTDIVDSGDWVEFKSKKDGKLKRQHRWYYDTSKLPASERGKARSKTFTGIARAMAEQWTK